ncbi:EcsC family protein [Pseudaestuariivita atlantica]|uniref:Protein EcsC n=1 Tax=Pseudaestuariivita atlantica TaxID=1317121 RepID=A0A0L1JTU6_9RHOB|nr:EcsC family protein [Pseudaestuariivita atlantica]KNG94833.1 protein EcsC [Pseudaestuariivita atlantica]
MDDNSVDVVEIPADLEAELAALARRYERADGLGLQVLNFIGDQAEAQVARLPVNVRDRLEQATLRALKAAMGAAHGTRDIGGSAAPWLDKVAATLSGAAGGFGGVPSALMELPVTTTLLLRAIQNVAVEHGYDPRAADVERDCLLVLAAKGPLAGEEDEGVDLGFLTARVAVSGTAVNALLARVAPRLAAALGQKLAAQAVPVVGAMTGAATNYAYVSYYQELAQVIFRLRKLSEERELPREVLVADLRMRLERAPVRRG